MGVQCIYVVVFLVGLPGYFLQSFSPYWSSLRRILSDAQFEDLFCGAAPQKSNSSLTNSTTSTE